MRRRCACQPTWRLPNGRNRTLSAARSSDWTKRRTTTDLVHEQDFGSLQDGTSHAKELLLPICEVQSAVSIHIVQRPGIPSGEVLSAFGHRGVQVPEDVHVDISTDFRRLVSSGDEVHATQSFVLHEGGRGKREVSVPPESGQRRRAYDLCILVLVEYIQRRSERPAQDRRVLCKLQPYVSTTGTLEPSAHSQEGRLTGDDGQPAPQIREADFRDVEPVDDDPALRRVDEAEERERQGALSRASAPEHADLLARLDLESQLVENVGQVRLQGA